MNAVKLRIKLGQLELDYDGPQEFVESGMMELIQQLSEVNIQDVAANTQPLDTGAPTTAVQASHSGGGKLSTTDFAVKLGVKSGSDLVMAAAAYFHHTKGLEEFRRSDLLSEMKLSKAFYRASYGSNLSKSLETLTKSGRLQNPKADTYTLPYAEISGMQNLL